MASVLMKLGSFRFSVDTAAYQELTRSNEYRWKTVNTVGQLGRQYIGEGLETISLNGTIYPLYKGGTDQLDDVREMARSGEPKILVDGRGNVWGKFTIDRVEERATHFLNNGAPRKQKFTISLTRYHDAAV